MAGKTLLNYDSAKKSPADKPDAVADMFGKIVGSKSGSSSTPATTSSEAKAWRSDEPAFSGAQAEELALLKSTYSESYFKQMMSHYRFLPGKAVQPARAAGAVRIPDGEDGHPGAGLHFHLSKLGNARQTQLRPPGVSGNHQKQTRFKSSRAGMSVSSLEGTSSGVSWFDPNWG